MSVVILGDPHLGKNLSQGKVGVGSTLNSRITDQANLLDWVLDRAIEHCSTDIIITGDVFEDPKPSIELIVLFTAWLKKCQVHDTKVHIILGNHDMLRIGNNQVSPLDIISEAEIDGVFVYKQIDTIYIDNTAFTLIPFNDRKSFQTQSNKEAVEIIRNNISYEVSIIHNTLTKVAIGHLAIEGSIPVGDEIDDLANELFCPLDIFEGYNYVWMGHVHAPQILHKNPYIAHIGSMDISNFGETDQKKHIVIFDTKKSLFVTEILPTRNLKKISIAIPNDTKDSTEFVLNYIKKQKNLNSSIVKIEISLESNDLPPIDKKSIEKLLSDKKVFNISGITESRKSNIIKKKETKEINTNLDVISAIKTYSSLIDEDKRSRFIETSVNIYKKFLEGK